MSYKDLQNVLWVNKNDSEEKKFCEGINMLLGQKWFTKMSNCVPVLWLFKVAGTEDTPGVLMIILIAELM